MFKKLVVTSLIGGIVSLGSISVANAATTTPGSTTNKFNCSNATTALQKISTADAKIAVRLPQLQAAEAKAEGHHRSAVALLDQDRIIVARQRKIVLDARATRIETVCHITAPGAATTTPTT